MAFSSGSRHEVRYQKEDTLGVKPTVPGTILLPINGTTLDLERSKLMSERLRSDRMISNVRSGNYRVQGSIDIELSHGDFDDLLANLFFNAWTDNVLKAGSQDQGSFLIERAFTDINQYALYLGCKMSKLSLRIAPDAMVTGTFDVIGANMELDQEAFDETPTDAQNNDPFDSFNGTLTEGTTEIAIVTGLEIDIDNGLNALYAVGSKAAQGISAKRVNVEGRLSAYFKDNTLLDKFLNETPSSLTVVLSDGTNFQTWYLPNIKYMGGNAPVQNDGEIILNMPFQAVLDSATNTCIQVTKSA